MSNVQKVLKLMEFFDGIKKNHTGCGDRWCSTCGGYAYEIIQKLPRNDKRELKDLLVQVSDYEYKQFDQWHDVLTELFPDIVNVNEIKKSIDNESQLRLFEGINRMIDSVDTTDIKEVEKYLYYNRYNYFNYSVKRPAMDSYYNYEAEYYYPFKKNYNLIDGKERKKYQEKYAKLLDIAIKNVIETKDYSLIESLAIILKGELYKYPKLKDLFLEVGTDKLVYNCLGVIRS